MLLRSLKTLGELAHAITSTIHITHNLQSTASI